MDGRPAVLKAEFLKPLLHERSVPIICVYAYWVTKENLFHILGHIQKCEKKVFCLGKYLQEIFTQWLILQRLSQTGNFKRSI